MALIHRDCFYAGATLCGPDRTSGWVLHNVKERFTEGGRCSPTSSFAYRARTAPCNYPLNELRRTRIMIDGLSEVVAFSLGAIVNQCEKTSIASHSFEAGPELLPSA